MTLALLILTLTLMFVKGRDLKALSKKSHIGNTKEAEGPEYIDLDIEPTHASLEEDKKSKDNMYLKFGDVMREFPRSRLYLKDILCEGRFSKTMTGEAWFIGGKDGVSDVIVTVAIEDKGDFKREVEVMVSSSKLKGVVEYLGCCITEDFYRIKFTVSQGKKVWRVEGELIICPWIPSTFSILNRGAKVSPTNWASTRLQYTYRKERFRTLNIKGASFFCLKMVFG
ncbi:uncharacterized protein [Ptychodera flava]|uniref:uncharacterized protein n=1 Tax=Ptychodera flava TaxID=63121 RepID=UPI00396A9698